MHQKIKQSRTILIIIDKRRKVLLIPMSCRWGSRRGSKEFHVAFTTFKRRLRLRGAIYQKKKSDTRWMNKSSQRTRWSKSFTPTGKSEKAAIIERAINVGCSIFLQQEFAEAVERSCRGNDGQRTNFVWPSHSIVNDVARVYRSEHHAHCVVFGAGPYYVPVIAYTQVSRRKIRWIDERRQRLEVQRWH